MSKILLSEEVIRDRVQVLGDLISKDYSGRTLDVICFINSASMFCADLVRHIKVPVKQHFLGFSSYPNSSLSGEVRITLDITEPLQGRHLLLVEGVIVSGRTPQYILELMKLRQPESVEICALAIKPKSLAVNLPLKYAAFELGPEIAVGYGVGATQQRALPHLVEAP